MIKPTPGFASGFNFDFVRSMPKWPAIPTVIMHLLQFAYLALLQKPVCGGMRRHPSQWPVDCELHPAFFGRCGHPVSLGECGGKGFLDENMRTVGGDLLNEFTV